MNTRTGTGSLILLAILVAAQMDAQSSASSAPSFPVLLVEAHRAVPNDSTDGFRGTHPIFGSSHTVNGIPWSGAGVVQVAPSEKSLGVAGPGIGALQLHVPSGAKTLKGLIGWFDPDCQGKGNIRVWARIGGLNGVMVWPANMIPVELMGAAPRPFEIPLMGTTRVVLFFSTNGRETCDDPVLVNAHYAN